MKFTVAISVLLTTAATTSTTMAFAPSFGITGTRSVTAKEEPQMNTERKKTNNRPLFGILDEMESDAYDLTSTADETEINMNDAYEMFLADLVFSTNNPKVDIINNIERAGDQVFIDWLDAKIENSKDPEERLALRDLFDMIEDVKRQIEVSKMAEQREAQEQEQQEKERLAKAEAQAQQGRALTNTEVLKKASAIDTAQAGDVQAIREEKTKVSFYDQQLTPEIRLSYEGLLKKVMPPYKGGETPTSIAFTYYDQFDAQFVKVLDERARSGDTDSQLLIEALAQEQQSRLADATNSLKEVLALGDAMRMEGAIVKMAREGKIDEPFLLLLEANATQARDAGALGPAQLMEKLRNRAMEEKDKQAASKEVALIRKLLRTETSAERELILEDAFTPRENLLVAGTAENAQKALDGEAPEKEEKPMPDVPPPDFLNACKAVLLNFGNLSTDDDRGDLASRIKTIASEAEVVATRIYGKGMTLREQQDRMWKEQTTSIFDLERMELEAESMGENAPWTNPDAPDDLIPGFDSKGRMQVGGG
mmetsp:Transcript_11306/g.16108  ORF Transcript_11306/g.16108 Transcript_11306/m.16108 type:complete len:538 (-) Transcript_11306:353-1966(-)